jgi:hypothetical protein
LCGHEQFGEKVKDGAALPVQGEETGMPPISVELARADRAAWSMRFVARRELHKNALTSY